MRETPASPAAVKLRKWLENAVAFNEVTLARRRHEEVDGCRLASVERKMVVALLHTADP